MVSTLEGKMVFKKSWDIPIYDFHFNEIKENPAILEGRGVYSDIYNTVTI